MAGSPTLCGTFNQVASRRGGVAWLGSVPLQRGVFTIARTLPFDASEFGARDERVCGGPDRGGRGRRDNLVGAKTAIPFLPSFLSTSGNDSPLFPSSLSLSPSAALIADRSSPLSSGAPPESVDRTRHERSALDDAVNDGGQSGRHHFCAARASHSLRGRRGFITFR